MRPRLEKVLWIGDQSPNAKGVKHLFSERIKSVYNTRTNKGLFTFEDANEISLACVSNDHFHEQYFIVAPFLSESLKNYASIILAFEPDEKGSLKKAFQLYETLHANDFLINKPTVVFVSIQKALNMPSYDKAKRLINKKHPEIPLFSFNFETSKLGHYLYAKLIQYPKSENPVIVKSAEIFAPINKTQRLRFWGSHKNTKKETQNDTPKP